jgi:acetyl esterase/lipase
MARKLIFLLLLFAALVLPLSEACASPLGRAERWKGVGEYIKPDAVYTYRTVDGIDLKGDFYTPGTGNGPFPVVVLIHGGGWRSGDKRDMARHAGPLTKEGYACFSINYRLTPEGRFPRDVEDCKAAVQWLRRQAGRLNIDPDRIAAMGGSAGGHLAAFIGATDDHDGFNDDEFSTSGRVQAVVALYGVFDFTAMGVRTGGLRKFAYLRSPDGKEEAFLQKISPATYISPDDPPVLMIHGVEDSLVPVEQSRLYSQALTDAGIENELILVEGVGHGFAPVKGMEMKPSWDEITRDLLDFLDKHLKEASNE